MNLVAILDFHVVWTYRMALVQGLETTLIIAFTSFAVGLVIAVPSAIGMRARHAAVRWPITAYVELVRGTPLLVQAMWLHFALPLVTHVSTTPVESGILALSLNTAAYATEIVRAGIGAVARGQFEAGAALGLRSRVVWARIVLPQALRAMLPPLASLQVSTIKGSALLSIIAVNDLTRIASRLSGATFHPVELFTSAALIYISVGLVVLKGTRALERRLALPV